MCAAPIVGWLPYGSSDPSVVARHPLTSAPTASQNNAVGIWPWGTRTIKGGVYGPQFNAAGMLCFDGVSGSTYEWSAPAAAIQGCTNEGQISLKVARDWACYADDESTGYIATNDECVLAFRNNSGTLLPYRIYKASGAAGVIFGECGALGLNKNFVEMSRSTQAVNCKLHTLMHTNEYITINVAWYGGVDGGDCIVAVDGAVMIRGGRVGAGFAGNMFDLMWLGHQGSATQYMTQHRIRDFQLSNRAPVFPMSNRLGRIGWLTDSLGDYIEIGGRIYPGGVGGDCTAQLALEQYLQQHGIRHGTMIGAEYGGYRVYDYGSNWLGTFRSTLLDCDTIIIGYAANDAVEPLWSADNAALGYLDHCDYFFGLGLYTTQTKRKRNVIICTTPDRRDRDYASQIAAQNKKILTVPARFYAANPSAVGRYSVQVVDINALTGGTNIPRSWFVDTVHWKYPVYPVIGRGLGKAIALVA